MNALCDNCLDHAADVVKIAFDIRIIKPHNHDTKRFKKNCPLDIIFRRIPKIMLFSIQLNDQFGLITIKINDVMSYDTLTIETHWIST